MSTQTKAELKKKAALTVTASRSPVPQRRSTFAQHVEDVSPSASLAEPGLGHDLSRVSIHPPTAPVAESCPLKAGPRVCPFGGVCHTCPTRVQARRTTRQLDDPYEEEAEQLAAQVETPQKDTPCVACADQSHSDQQSGRNRPKTLDEIGEHLSASSQSLDGETRAFMEERFGVNFSGVRIHTGQEAHLAAQVLRAAAFTIGNHVFFSHGEFNPGTTEGKNLLAHELTHVIQQGNAAISLQSPGASTQAEASLEGEADATAQRVSSEPAVTFAASHSAEPARPRAALPSAPLGFLLRGRWRQPGQSFLDCVNNCLSNQGFAATVGGLIVAVCGVIAALAAAAATPETGGAATVPVAVIVAAACAGAALGVPTGLMASCMWECRG